MPTQPHSNAAVSGTTDGQFGAAYRVLEEAIAARAFPGCAFGVLAGGEVVLKDALGRFTYEPESPVVLAETRFDVASLTKVVATTAAAMLLVQRRQIDLETPLGEILPGFVAGRTPGDMSRHVTLRHLLAHNSGLPGYAELFRQATNPDSLMRACMALPLEAEPGTRAEYSDPGFILLGKAIETQIHEPLDSWLRREIFGPLKMDSTGYCPAPAERNSIPPTEEDTWFRNRLIQGEVQDENASVLKGVSGHAGLFSTIADLLRYAGEILGAVTGNGTARGAGLVDLATVNRFSERQEPEGTSRALGWDTPSADSTSGKYFSARSIGHLGFSGCSLWIDLDAAITVVLLTNRTWPDRKNRMIRQVWPVFHDAIREALQSKS